MITKQTQEKQETITDYKLLMDFLITHESGINTELFCGIKSMLEDYTHSLSIFQSFDIPFSNSVYRRARDYFEISSNQCISFYSKGNNRQISWSDDDRQPEGEWLYCIRFPTGAYIFSQDYPTKTFNSFFNELKGFNPKYTDSANKSLYFTADNAKSAHNEFNSIMEKYRAKVSNEIKEMKIAKLKADLDKLEGDL